MIQNGRKPQNRYFIILLLMAATTILSLAWAIISRIHLNRTNAAITAAGKLNPSYSLDSMAAVAQAAEAEGKQNALNALEESFSAGMGTTTILRNTFPDKVVYYNADHYEFHSINHSLPLHSLNRDLFIMDDNGVMSYQDSTVQTHKGIDVSKYQGDIDWSLVAQDGIEFAFLRLGYRAYGSGALTEDENFKNNAAGALQNNLHVGAYFFTQAVTKEEAEEEAQFVIDLLKGYKIDYPIAIDVEEIVGDTYRQQDVSRNDLTEIVIAFCEKIKQAGYTPMIYGNLKGLIGLIDIEKLAAYEKWYAEYSSYPYIPYEFGIWQYSESGSVNGINGPVDLNIGFKTW